MNRSTPKCFTLPGSSLPSVTMPTVTLPSVTLPTGIPSSITIKQSVTFSTTAPSIAIMMYYTTRRYIFTINNVHFPWTVTPLSALYCQAVHYQALHFQPLYFQPVHYHQALLLWTVAPARITFFGIRNSERYTIVNHYTATKRYTAKRYTIVNQYTATKRYSAKRYTAKRYTTFVALPSVTLPSVTPSWGVTPPNEGGRLCPHCTSKKSS